MNKVNDVVLVSLLLTLNKFHSMFWHFHCWLWTSRVTISIKYEGRGGGRGSSLHSGGVGYWGGLQSFNVCVNVVLFARLVRMKRLLQRKYLFWPILLTSQYFCMFFKFHNFANFYVFRKLHAIQNQNMVPDFSVYFDVKSFSFAKINPHEISKPMYLRKLIQAKILFCNSEPKTSCKKTDADNKPFQWRLIILYWSSSCVYWCNFQNSFAKKILP